MTLQNENFLIVLLQMEGKMSFLEFVYIVGFGWAFCIAASRCKLNNKENHKFDELLSELLACSAIGLLSWGVVLFHYTNKIGKK